MVSCWCFRSLGNKNKMSEVASWPQLSKFVSETTVSVEVSSHNSYAPRPVLLIIQITGSAIASLRLIYDGGSPADCCSRWFFLFEYLLTSSWDPGVDIGLTLCCTTLQRAESSWYRGLDYQSKKFVCCLSGVLIQKEIRNSCLVFRR